jgi:beta-glucosidase/6-phospho-beta-glucosidase/beta-galactosidase
MSTHLRVVELDDRRPGDFHASRSPAPVRLRESPKPARIEFIGSFESTFQPRHDVDVAESNGHAQAWREDLALLRACSVRRLRYPVRWHRVEAVEARYDWDETDEIFDHMRRCGLAPIPDLVHHTSYPRWLAGGFADARFPSAYLRYVEAFAARYPWVREYTLFNEPFSTLFLCGHEGIWPPYGRGIESFVRLLGNVLPAIAAASRLCRDMLPNARHVHVDSCEQHTGEGEAGLAYARYANDRRFFVLDALLGRADDGAARPFVDHLVSAGGASLLRLEPGLVDTVGLDYYAHCQWHFAETPRAPAPQPAPLAELIGTYSRRYERPCLLSETNLRGYPSDRATWLKYTLEQCEIAVAAGVLLEGYCWFPFVDSCDWDSLLADAHGNIDPVGVFAIDPARTRHASSMSAAYARAARGAPAADLPAYRLREPASIWLAGYAPQLAEWTWQKPPAGETIATGIPGDSEYRPLGGRV